MFGQYELAIHFYEIKFGTKQPFSFLLCLYLGNDGLVNNSLLTCDSEFKNLYMVLKDKRSLKVFNVNDCLSKNTCMCLERSMEDEKTLGNYFFNRKHSIDASSYYKDPEKNKEIYPLSIAHDLKSSHLMIVNSLGNVIYLNHDLNRKKLTEEKYIKLKFWRDDKRKMTV